MPPNLTLQTRIGSEDEGKHTVVEAKRAGEG